MELLEYEIRSGGVWVRYRNTGDQETTTACFRIKIYDNGDRLIDEREEAVYETAEPGSTKENIIKLYDVRAGEPVDLSDKRVGVEFRYGYLE